MKVAEVSMCWTTFSTIGALVVAGAVAIGCTRNDTVYPDAGADCYEGGYATNAYMPPLEQAIDLDSGSKLTCLGSDCSAELPDEPWDFMFTLGSDNWTPYVLPHGSIGAGIVNLGMVDFDSVSDCDIDDAAFQDSQLPNPPDSGHVLLVRTDLGDVFKIDYYGWDDCAEFDGAIYFRFASLTP
jgi:hypothetical protein